MRIVSLIPSATEIVCELGLGDQLVGVTHECDYPSFVRDLPKVTKTLIPLDATSHEIDSLVRQQLKTQQALYTLDLPTLERLRPELIVTQALCDVCAVAQSEVTAAACSLPGQPRVVNLEPTCLADVLECIQIVGDAANAPDAARSVLSRLRDRIDAVEKQTRLIEKRPSVVLLEWIDPPFSSGHWSPEFVRIAGGVEAIGIETERSRTIPWNTILEANPDVMVIACCGFDIERTKRDLPILHAYPGYEQLKCVRTQNVHVMDGNAYFNRPGPRLVDSLEMLANVIRREGEG